MFCLLGKQYWGFIGVEWWLLLCANLARLWCPFVWSNTSIEVMWRYFVDVIIIYNQLILIKRNHASQCGRASYNHLKDLKTKHRSFTGQEEILPQGCSIEILLECPACQTCDSRLYQILSETAAWGPAPRILDLLPPELYVSHL